MKLTVPAPVLRIIPASSTPLPRWAVVSVVPLVAVLILAGVWATGGLITNDESLARQLTGLWFGLAGATAVLAALRWRQLAAPVLVTWLVVSGLVAGFLVVTSSVDRVVNEQVAVAGGPAPSGPTASEGQTAGPPAGDTAVVSGTFTDGAHPTSGTATVIDRPDGSRVLTLTGFATDPGPDLRVLLTADAAGQAVDGAADLGSLKGNKGDQQYVLPANSPIAAVVIWCRAFTVAFGTAALAG